jgi:hypothetical protein
LGGINANGVRATALRFGTTFGPFLGLLLEKETDRSVAVVHVSDKPIAEALPEIRALTELHGRVLAVEPLFLGGNQPGGGNAWQYGMALQAAGERLLGIQAAEINSVCGWLIEERGASEIRLIAYGPLSGTAAVVAAALADPPVDRIRLHRGIDKFLQLVQDEVEWDKNQALFCFGLQAAFEHIELLNILSRRGVEVELDRS